MITYVAFLNCDHCGDHSPIYSTTIPIDHTNMRDLARKDAKAAGWICVRENDGKKDYCPACRISMKMEKVKSL